MLTKSGAGSLTIGTGAGVSQPNAFSTVYLNGGRLNLGGMDHGVHYGNCTVGTLYFGGGTLVVDEDRSGSFAPIAAGQKAILNTGNLGYGSNTFTFAHGISGDGGLTKVAAGTLTSPRTIPTPARPPFPPARCNWATGPPTAPSPETA